MALKQVLVKAIMEKTAGKVIEKSLNEVSGGWIALVEAAEGKKLVYVVKGESNMAKMLKDCVEVEEEGLKVYIAALNSNNAAVIRRFVKWTAPSACGTKGTSIGFTDWLGAADAAVTDLFVKKQMKPVLVEFTPEGSAAVKRNLLEAVDTATWGVLEKGYKEGYGANAANIKSEDDLVKGLLYGYSMLGIDCSDKIDLEIEKLTDEQVEKRFEQFNDVFRAAVNASYLNVEFKVGNNTISFKETQLHRIILEYGEAIMHIQFLYNSYMKSTPWDIDFELSLSKPGKQLTPQEHYLIANELQRNGIKVTSICLDAFNEKETLAENLAIHADIAETYNYRLSFSNADMGIDDLAAVVKATKGRVHLKANNILWMNVVHLLAEKNPELYSKLAAAAGCEAVASQELCASATGKCLADYCLKALDSDNSEIAAEIRGFVLENKAAYQERFMGCVQECFLKRM